MNILKLMGLVKKSDFDRLMKLYTVTNGMNDSLLEQNIALGEAYEDLRRDRDRLAKRLKAHR
jgi:hypothetical protein